MRLKWLVLGGLIVGALDFLDTVVFFGLRSGTTPARIDQSIAAGLQGARRSARVEQSSVVCRQLDV